MKTAEILTHLMETVHRLRAPGGCPWDRAQTHQSLRQYLIEEAYEVLDVLDEIKNSEDLKKEPIQSSFQEELGDLLMQVLLHSEMASEVGAFSLTDVARALDEKLIRRHPHVFGQSQADTAEAAIQNWEKQKAKEKTSQPHASVLDGLPKNLPALQKAARMIEKTTRVGFQWKDPQESLQKISTEEELGDVLFSLCHRAFLLKISPEDALRGTLARLGHHFRQVEKRLKGKGKTPSENNIQIWGLTGGIASGKSTVAKFCEEAGIPVIDADQIARELSREGGGAYPTIIKRFGTADRVKLRDLIFSDSQARRDLEGILHPLIQEESQRMIQKLNTPIVIYEATLLVETGRYLDLAGLIVVQTPRSEQIRRLQARDQIPPELAEKILNSQASDKERKKAATWIIDNSGNLEDLKKQTKNLVSQLLRKSSN